MRYNKSIVLYTSKYGSTKKYAGWLSDELSCDIEETKNVNILKIQQYDVVVLGGGIYAGGIAGLSFLKKNYEKLKTKKLIVFAVGASPYDEKAMAEMRKRHFSDKLTNIPCFYCRGAWNENAMTRKDSILCNMLKKMVSKKDPVNYEPWEKALMQAIGSNHDWTDKDYLKPIIENINEEVSIYKNSGIINL